MTEMEAAASQYLTLTLLNETYALEILKVREVLDLTSITHVPRMPEFMRGVINLRGNVVPVVDLRLCLGLPMSGSSGEACIIIVDIKIEDTLVPIGMLADSVQEVTDIASELIRPANDIGTWANTQFMKGISPRQEGFIIILDIDKVMSTQQLEAVAQTNSSSN